MTRIEPSDYSVWRHLFHVYLCLPLYHLRSRILFRVHWSNALHLSRNRRLALINLNGWQCDETIGQSQPQTVNQLNWRKLVCCTKALFAQSTHTHTVDYIVVESSSQLHVEIVFLKKIPWPINHRSMQKWKKLSHCMRNWKANGAASRPMWTKRSRYSARWK